MTSRAVLVRAFAAALALGVTAGDAHAEGCPSVTELPVAANVDAQARLEFLDHAFAREIDAIDTWSWTWGGIYTAGTAAEGVDLALTKNHGGRIDLEVGVISTAFGAVSLTVLPLQLTLPLRAGRRHLATGDHCAALAYAEHTLLAVEKDQAFATGIVGHLGNVAVNIGIALILGLGYGRWGSAALSGGIGVAVGEANAFTQPHHLREVLAQYRSGRLFPPNDAVAWTLVPVATHDLTGAALQLTW